MQMYRQFIGEPTFFNMFILGFTIDDANSEFNPDIGTSWLTSGLQISVPDKNEFIQTSINLVDAHVELINKTINMYSMYSKSLIECAKNKEDQKLKNTLISISNAINETISIYDDKDLFESYKNIDRIHDKFLKKYLIKSNLKNLISTYYFLGKFKESTSKLEHGQIDCFEIFDSIKAYEISMKYIQNMTKKYNECVDDGRGDSPRLRLYLLPAAPVTHDVMPLK